MKGMKYLLVILSVMFLCVIYSAEANWYNTNWQYRKQITISGSMTPNTNQTNFPLLIRRTSDSNLASRAQGDGDDILFTSSNGSTKLDHEIEKYVSSTGELWAWVKIPTLPTGTTTVIYMYYGHPTIASQQNATGVWSNGYEAVYHLNGNFLDSTSNARNATNSGTADATGRTANGRDFEYSDSTDRLSLGTWNVSGSNLTIQTWVNFEGFSQDDARLVTKSNSENEQDHVFMLSTYLPGANEVLRVRLKTGTADGSGTTTFVATSGALSTGTWYLAAATYDGANMTLYLNGTSVGSTAKTGDIRQNSWGITAGNNITGTNQPLDGILDEIRISSAARSADWLTTEYRNQNAPDTYITLGSEERAPADAVFFGTEF